MYDVRVFNCYARLAAANSYIKANSNGPTIEIGDNPNFISSVIFSGTAEQRYVPVYAPDACIRATASQEQAEKGFFTRKRARSDNGPSIK